MAEEFAWWPSLIRLGITVEGETEEDFVNDVLGPHLISEGIYADAVLLGKASRSVGGGGNVTIERLAADMASHYYRFDVVTSLVDFYGFRNKGTRTVEELEQAVIQEADRMLRPNWDRRKIVSYVQLHEFEGLLFSQVSAFTSVPGANETALSQMERIRSQFPSPEDINDNPNTAPSRRILQVLPEYDKRIDGPQIAQAIGLHAIRRECPRFNSWVNRLESLAE